MRPVAILIVLALSACGGTAVSTVVHMNRAEHRQVGGGKAEIWLLARGDNAFVGRLELAAGFKVPKHRDPTEEYIHVLRGSGALTIDGKVHQLTAGSTVFMPANAEVSFVNGPERMVALQIFAGPGPADKYSKWQVVQ